MSGLVVHIQWEKSLGVVFFCHKRNVMRVMVPLPGVAVSSTRGPVV